MTSKEIVTAAFAILECSDESSEEQVKSAYRQLVKVWHPDRFEADSALKSRATEKMQLLNEAYEFLTKIFEQRRMQIASENRAPAPSECKKAQPSQESSTNPAYKVGEETVTISKARDPDTGQIFFKKVITTVTAYDGRWLSTSSQVFETRAAATGDDYESASSNSMSFRLKTDQATSQSHLHYSRLRPGGPYEVDSEWGHLYRFADGSRVTHCGERKDTLFHDEIRKAEHGRVSSDLSELAEAYQIFKKRNDFKACVGICQRAVDLHPKNSWGWIQRSFILHLLSMTKPAFDALRPAAELFPKEITVFYNLACYSAQLGDQKGARAWLAKVFQLAEQAGPTAHTFKQYQAKVANDPDLIPLRDAIPHEPISWKLRRFFGV
jgi:curved DNA-binding protein CbpA